MRADIDRHTYTLITILADHLPTRSKYLQRAYRIKKEKRSERVMLKTYSRRGRRGRDYDLEAGVLTTERATEF